LGARRVTDEGSLDGRNRVNSTISLDIQRDLRRPSAGTIHALAQSVRVGNQGPLVLAIFLVTQVLDGSLTYWGVSRFGLDVELNFYLAWFMGAVGAGPALVGAKALACACGVILFQTASHRTLAAATGWCIGFAVVPWVLLATAFS
jgi:hypothetical protein